MWYFRVFQFLILGLFTKFRIREYSFFSSSATIMIIIFAIFLNSQICPPAGLMLAHHVRRWANISPVLGYRVLFGATLNVGQPHRWRANINPALVQSIIPVPPACRYRQHDRLGRNGYWPAPTMLAQHLTNIGSVSACTRRQQYALPSRWASIEPALIQRLVFLGVLTSHIVCRTLAWFQDED